MFKTVMPKQRWWIDKGETVNTVVDKLKGIIYVKFETQDSLPSHNLLSAIEIILY